MALVLRLTNPKSPSQKLPEQSRNNKLQPSTINHQLLAFCLNQSVPSKPQTLAPKISMAPQLQWLCMSSIYHIRRSHLFNHRCFIAVSDQADETAMMMISKPIHRASIRNRIHTAAAPLSTRLVGHICKVVVDSFALLTARLQYKFVVQNIQCP